MIGHFVAFGLQTNVKLSDLCQYELSIINRPELSFSSIALEYSDLSWRQWSELLWILPSGLSKHECQKPLKEKDVPEGRSHETSGESNADT